MNSKTEHYHIVVTYNIGEKEKELLVKTVPEGTYFSFLIDLSEEERKKALQAADLLFPGTSQKNYPRMNTRCLRGCASCSFSRPVPITSPSTISPKE